MNLFASAREFWLAGGPLMPWIAAASFGVWLHFLRLRADMVRGLRGVPAWSDRVRTAAEEARVGGEDPAVALDRLIRHTADGLSREIGRVDALTTVAPLLGLLGTVFGMVDTFTALAVGRGAGDTAQAVAGGISQALITTQVGLVVALPGLFGAARLRRLARQTTLVLETERAALLREVPSGAGG